MTKLVLGGVLTLLILAVIGIGAALLGFLPTHANTPPPRMEMHLAMSALDASMERHAPRTNNPIPPTDENLIEGLKLYTMNCALCHGGLDRKPSALGKSFYPPAPSLILYPIDDPEWRVFYTIRTGIRYTGMPAWDKTLSESDMWKVTSFLTRVEKLPPAVQEFWKKSAGTEPPAEDEPGHAGHDHSDHK